MVNQHRTSETPLLSSGDEFPELQPELENVLRNAVRALGGSAAVVATWDDASHKFVVTGSYGLGAGEILRISPLLNEAIPDLALSREQFALLSALFRQSALPVSTTGQMQNPVMAVPLRTGGETVGLIVVLRSSEAANFSRLDPPVLAAFAEQAAIAVQSARLAHLLAQEKRRVESILEGSADGIYTVDSARRIVSVNPAMERLLGRSREDLIGLPCAVALNWRDREGRPVCPGQCPMLHSPVPEAEHVTELAAGVRSRNGQHTDVALVYSVVRSPEMLPLNAVVNVRDMTRMRETEDMRSAFLSMLGHQLQTPLAIIKGYTNTLSRSDADWDSSTLHRIFEAIEEETDHMSQLMNRLLLASRLETGELPINHEQVQLSALAQKAVGRLQPAANNHDFSVEYPDYLPTVSGDPGLLEEVIMNLLDNAVKYSPDGGSIEILVDGDAARGVTLTVKDHGVGVPRWETRRIFERFHRSQHPVSVQTRGMGIGLYICDAVMTSHGGTVHVESTLGMGSSFTLTFPEAVVSP